MNGPPPRSPLAGQVTVARERADGVVALFTVDPGEPVFAGHFPGFPILPGVCLVECAHHSVLALAGLRGQAVTLAAVESARFLSPVFPGDRLLIDVHVAVEDGAWQCRANLGTERARAADVRLRYRLEGAA